MLPNDALNYTFFRLVLHVIDCFRWLDLNIQKIFRDNNSCYVLDATYIHGLISNQIFKDNNILQ